MPYLGEAEERRTGDKYQLLLSSEERKQGTYVIGTTGTGKTTLLRNLMVEDMWLNHGEGLCVLDPHGDLVDELLAWVPPNRIQDVIYFNPLDTERPIGLNFLDCDRNNEHEMRHVVSNVMETLNRLFFYSWGPRLEHILRYALYTTLRIPNSSLAELLLLLTKRAYREEIIGKPQPKGQPRTDHGILDPRKDDRLINFWYDYFLAMGDRERVEAVSAVINKLSPFLLDSMIRNIIGQSRSSLDILKIMDEGKILLVNLSKGDLTETNSTLLGSVLVNQVLIAALRRRGLRYQQGRRQFHLVVDEYQNFATRSFAILQSEARKFGVDVTVAHQYRDQLDEESMGASLNVGNLVVFRISGRDSDLLAKQFDNTPPPGEIKSEPALQPYMEDGQGTTLYTQQPTATHQGSVYRLVRQQPRLYADVEGEMANALSTLDNYQAYCRLTRQVKPYGSNQPQSFLGEYLVQTYPKPQVERQSPNWPVRERCIEHSRQQYGRDRQEVEAEIFERTHGQAQDFSAIPDSEIVSDI